MLVKMAFAVALLLITTEGSGRLYIVEKNTSEYECKSDKERKQIIRKKKCVVKMCC